MECCQHSRRCKGHVWMTLKSSIRGFVQVLNMLTVCRETVSAGSTRVNPFLSQTEKKHNSEVPVFSSTKWIKSGLSWFYAPIPNHGSGMTTDLWQSQHFLILGTAWYFVLQSIMHHAHVLLWRPIKATELPTKLITWCVTLTDEHCAGSYVKQRECVCIPEECVTPLPWGDPQTPWLWAIALCCRCVWSVDHCSENKKQEEKKNEPLELWRDAEKWNWKTVIMLRHRQIMWYINGLKTQTAVWYLRLKCWNSTASFYLKKVKRKWTQVLNVLEFTERAPKPQVTVLS